MDGPNEYETPSLLSSLAFFDQWYRAEIFGICATLYASDVKEFFLLLRLAGPYSSARILPAV